MGVRLVLVFGLFSGFWLFAVLVSYLAGSWVLGFGLSLLVLCFPNLDFPKVLDFCVFCGFVSCRFGVC